MSVSPELLSSRRVSDREIYKRKTIAKISDAVRALGYQLACREIYGENTPDYYRKKDEHRNLLNKLYALQKKA
jgi:hypothetical protein